MKSKTWVLILLFAALFLSGATSALAGPLAVCTSAGSGNWSSSSTWNSPCNVAGGPTGGDIVVVQSGHTVTVDGSRAANILIVVGTLTETGGAGDALSATSITIDGGSFTSPDNGLTVSGDLTLTTAGSSLTAGGSVNIGGSLSNSGTFNSGSAQSSFGGDVNNKSGATFTASSGTMTISGNFSNSGTFTHNSGTIALSGSAAKSISGVGTLNNLTINNSAGVDLNSAATVNGTLALNYDLRVAGTNALTMASGSQTLGSADVVGETKRTSIAASTAYTFGSPYTTIIFGSGGTLPTALSVKLIKTAPGGLANAVQRHYAITPTGGSGYTFDLRLHYLDAELSGITESNIQMWQSVGGRWTLRAVTSRDTANNWVEKTGLASFSYWGLSDNGGPTAVTLSSFAARADAPDVLPLIALGIGALIVVGAWRRRA